MKVVAISDTHNRHEGIEVVPCDLLLHAGDVTARGTLPELEAFLAWFGRQPARHRVFIAGNHDRCIEAEPARTRALAGRHGAAYLQDESLTIDGVRLWGSPVTPRFRDMAFNRGRGAEIAAHWREIPDRVDLLVTHTPPYGILDRMFLGMHIGCEALREHVVRRAPRVHVFGHVHEAHGEDLREGIRFINAASSRLLRRRPRTARVFVLQT